MTSVPLFTHTYTFSNDYGMVQLVMPQEVPLPMVPWSPSQLKKSILRSTESVPSELVSSGAGEAIFSSLLAALSAG